MNIRRILLEDLEANAAMRPEGYKEEILSLGKVVGNKYLEMPDDDYRALMLKYNKTNHDCSNRQPETSEISKLRFEICKKCDQSTDQGFGCKFHKTCCFGRWRANPKNKCYASPSKWDAV